MESKEAVNRLYNHLKAILEEDAPELIRIIKSYYDIIEKDLEASEILKKYLFIVEPDNEEDFKEFDTVDYLRLMDYMTREEYQVIKEWLEK